MVLSPLHDAIEKTAQAILDARAKHSTATLADLYDPDAMHLAPDTPEPEIVTHLFKLYAEKVK